jgi:ribonuclease BN (tRNA processing enzyme)
MYEKQREKPLHVAGPAGTEEKVRGLFSLMYDSGKEPRDVSATLFYRLDPNQTKTIDGIDVFSFRVPHQVHAVSLALKVSYDNKQILFSGDAAWTDEFIRQSRGVDLFLCECTFYDRQTPNHMNYLELKEQLPRLQCDRIILTHLGSDMLARQSEVAYTLAADGMVIEI